MIVGSCFIYDLYLSCVVVKSLQLMKKEINGISQKVWCMYIWNNLRPNLNKYFSIT